MHILWLVSLSSSILWIMYYQVDYSIVYAACMLLIACRVQYSLMRMEQGLVLPASTNSVS